MKPSPEFQYTIENRLAGLHTMLLGHALDGVHMSSRQVRAMINEIEHVQIEAVAMRNELSAKRWQTRGEINELAHVVQRETRTGNVVLFPVVARPVPITAIQKGGRS